ncbi:MAG: hypothetical protein HY063_15265 [Bacteroidetes bacterium]|nr:hypothetical protein [Bacteroidota bacterium]
MKAIRNIATLLKKHEAQRFINYLYPQQKPDKTLELFRLLRAHKRKKISVQEMQEFGKKIYPIAGRDLKSRPTNRLDVLHHRLREDVLDFLTSNSFLKNHPVLEPLHAAQVEIKKKWAQQYILRFTGRTGEPADSLLDEAIALAKKYEYYNELIKLIQTRRLERAYRFGERELNKTTAEIKRYEKCERAVRRANEIYYRILIWQKFHANPDKKKLRAYEKKVIKELHRLHAQTKASEVLYFLRYIEIDFYQQRQQYDKAREACIQLLNIVYHYPAVQTRPRFDYVFGNLAQCHVYEGDYSKALDALSEIHYLTHQPLDWAESKEMETRILFYQRKYQEAMRLLNKIIKKLPEDAEPVRVSRLHFIRACILFAQENKEAAKKIMERKLYIRKDKTGWNIAVRMLELMLLTEEKSVRSFRMAKHLKKFLLTQEKKSTRDTMLAALFFQMSKNNFMFRNYKEQFRRTQKLFSMQKGKYAWNPLGHELIKYDAWLKKIYS